MADVKKILSKMTVDEKIGQLVQVNANLYIDADANITGEKTALGLNDDNLQSMGHILNFTSPVEMLMPSLIQ